MFTTTDNFTIAIKENAKKIKNISKILMGICALFFIVYILYYGLMAGSNDKEILEQTEPVFRPIADYFHSEIQGLDIYKETALTFIKFLVPLYVVYFITEFIQNTILKMHNKSEEIKSQNLKKIEKREYLQQFEKIKYYSIAVSFDYSKGSGSEIPLKAINQLNNVIYEKLNTSIGSHKLRTSTKGIFTVVSQDFMHYDSVYENLLKTVARIRNLISEKYNIEVIPTITTDAHNETPLHDNIVKSHFAVKGCNLKNKAMNTSLFCKKYNFLGFSKFIGTSIGVYNNNEPMTIGEVETYDLNIVIKNLAESFDNF